MSFIYIYSFYTLLDITSSLEEVGFRNLVQKLGEEEISGLPPGGGLESK